MINVPWYLSSLKWVIPAVILLGTAPSHFMMWCLWRGLSCLCPRYIYEIGDDILWDLYQRIVLFFYEHYTGLKIIVYDDTLEAFKRKENILFMMNHQSTVDWTVVNMLAGRQGSLGSIRYVLKDGLRYFPMYGFYFHHHNCIYVKRAGNFQEEKAVEQLNKMKVNNTKFWVVLFPEGTRYNTEKRHVITKSEQFAKDQGLQVLEHHLTPRVKFAWLSIQNLREKMDAIYDVTVIYKNTFKVDGRIRGPAPGLVDFLNISNNEMHLIVTRIDIKDVPHDEDKFKIWLHDRFIIKDGLINRFISNDPAISNTLGRYPQRSTINLMSTLPAFLLYVLINLPLYGTELGRQILWQVALGTTILGCIWMKIKS